MHPLITRSQIPLIATTSTPYTVVKCDQLANAIECHVERKADLLYPILTQSLLQFPETRLVQYDCGRLLFMLLLYINARDVCSCPASQKSLESHKALSQKMLSKLSKRGGLKIFKYFLCQHFFHQWELGFKCRSAG